MANFRWRRRDAPCGRPVVLEQNHIGVANIFPALQEKSEIPGGISADGRKGRPYEGIVRFLWWGCREKKKILPESEKNKKSACNLRHDVILYPGD